MLSWKRFSLAPHENELVELIAAGFSNREIAEKLYLSEGTVRSYLTCILDKLALRDRTQLAIYYYRRTDGMKRRLFSEKLFLYAFPDLHSSFYFAILKTSENKRGVSIVL